ASWGPPLDALLAAAVLHDPFRRRRMLRELAGGTARPRDELAAAVRALPGEHVVRAARAEGALEGADEGVAAVRGKIAVATFAIRTKLEHPDLVSHSRTRKGKALGNAFPFLPVLPRTTASRQFLPRTAAGTRWR